MMSSNMKAKNNHTLSRPSLQSYVERGWLALLASLCVIVIVVGIVGIFLGRYVNKGYLYSPKVEEYPFTQDVLTDVVRRFDERSIQFETLRGAPVYLVDPAR